MASMTLIRDLFLLTTIAGLLVVGVGIALRSGLVARGRDRCGRLAGNLSRLVVTLAAYAAALAAVQHAIGFRMGMP